MLGGGHEPKTAAPPEAVTQQPAAAEAPEAVAGDPGRVARLDPLVRRQMVARLQQGGGNRSVAAMISRSPPSASVAPPQASDANDIHGQIATAVRAQDPM